jgi:hypothetical protein
VRLPEADLSRLEVDLAELDEPIRDRLAVIPSWVRPQVTDVVGLLSDTTERAKREFQRLGVSRSLSRRSTTKDGHSYGLSDTQICRS